MDSLDDDDGLEELALDFPLWAESLEEDKLGAELDELAECDRLCSAGYHEEEE